jgi:hypothetical protein
MFTQDISADSACFEDYLDCCALHETDSIQNAYKASVEFLKLYCNEFGFEIISLQEFKDSFNSI